MSLNIIEDSHMMQAMVWTIIHSLWQFTLLALIMSVLLKIYQNNKSSIRYYISLTSIILAFLVFAITFGYYYFSGGNENVTHYFHSQISDVNIYIREEMWWAKLYHWIDVYQKPIYITWMIGVGLFVIRFVGSIAYVDFLVRNMNPVNNYDTTLCFEKMTTYFNIKDKVKFGESKHVHSPMILGFLKPVILFPIGMINQLDYKETEAVLAHELAHFVRKDLYINIIQTLIEALLYYHPAIWWISANIRVERENCCDELAITYMGDNVKYAKTLVKIQEIQQNGPMLALHFSQNNSFFSNRIKRILNMAQTRNFLKEKIITSCVLVILVMLFTKDLSGNIKQQPIRGMLQSEQKNIVTVFKNDSIPNKRESIRIQKKTNNKEVNISMENGEVTELEIDGKKIDPKDYELYKDIIDESKPMSHGDVNSKIFFFGDENMKNGFQFKLDDQIYIDSLFQKFGFKGLDELGGLNNDQGRLAQQLQQLQEQLGKLDFNFKGLDSMNFDFAFPELEKLKDHPNFKIFEFKDGDTYALPYGEFSDEMPEFDGQNNNKNFSDALGSSLNRDGLLIPGEQNKVELTGKYLKINGEKQPNNIFQKYKRIFEEESGTSLQKKSKLQFLFEGKVAKRKFKVY